MGAGLTIPALAVALLPQLSAEIDQHWPDLSPRSTLAGQIEQETCPSLRSPRCFSPRAELRTARERGVGLGQFTKTARFDALSELREKHPDQLGGWSWKNPYDATYQLRGLVLKDRDDYLTIRGAANSHERMAFTLSSYNGGRGGVNSDRVLCAHTRGCNPEYWFGNVEHTSLKQKTTVKGYGKSFFDINREYVRNIYFTRRAKYAPYLDKEK